jgi:hypothetical protein
LTKTKEIKIRANGKSWWSSELNEIKRKLIELKSVNRFNKSEETSNMIKLFKKQFRKIQRQQVFLYDLNGYYRVDNLAKIKNKYNFWKSVREYKSKNNSKEEKVDIETKILRDYYKNYFNQTQNNENEMHITISNKVKDFEEKKNQAFEEGKNLNKKLFEKLDIEYVIKRTKTSNTKGYDGMNNNMIKYGHSNYTSSYLLWFFNFIKVYNIIPNNFNLGIINPLIKDKNKSNDDVKNQRPITISNPLSQLFERLLLENMPILKGTNKTQFGFKEKSSCNHAIFTLKETILNYTENGSNCYVISLDAEKAFDRVWRDGLLFKLMNKIDDEVWILIK